MNNIIFLIFLLISSSFSRPYQKMKKSHGYDDDICEYAYSSIYYVKPCEEGYFCKDFGDLSKCKEIETQFQGKVIGETCSSDFECEKDLECQQTCTLSCGTNNNLEAYKTYSGNYGCRDKNEKNILYKADKTGINSYALMYSYIMSTPSPLLYQLPSFFQVPGKITFFQQTDTVEGTIYAIDTIESAYIGSLDDGTFVMNEMACKSGFALYFYPNGNDRIDPSKNEYNRMYLKCVTLNDVNTEKKYVKYDEKYFYDYNGPFKTFDYYSITNTQRGINIPQYPLIKKELFSKYIGVFTPTKQAECENEKKFLEQHTCEDSEARKWYYFYQNPEEYVLYYDEEEKDNDIMNFLLQKEYKTFISGQFLYMKFLISIAILLFL